MDGLKIEFSGGAFCEGQRAAITPGLWESDAYGYIIAGDRCLGAVNCEADTDENRAERMANATIMAAAPRLAAALELCRMALKQLPNPEQHEIVAIAAADMALSAAAFTIPAPVTAKRGHALGLSGLSVTIEPVNEPGDFRP